MPQPTVFLDRDGVLIHEVHYLSDLQQIRIFADVAQGLTRLKDAGFLLIMITNQSGVARGYFNEDFVQEVYQNINESLHLDAMYYCPHHLKGHAPYNIPCHCRKPKPGMIEQAMSDFTIDPSKSFMIGDKLCDVELASNAGITGIQLLTGHGVEEEEKVRSKFPQTPIFPSFSQAVDFILSP